MHSKGDSISINDGFGNVFYNHANGHVTDQMRRDSADRMQQYIDSIKTD